MKSNAPRSLRNLARAVGVQTQFRDNAGIVRRASDNALAAVISALGFAAASEREIAAAIVDLALARKRRMLDEVAVVWQNGSARVKAASALGRCRFELIDEHGKTLNWQAEPLKKEGAHSAVVQLPKCLTPGYYCLRAEARGKQAESLLIVAPRQVYQHSFVPEGKPWGVFAPVYALRTSAQWGVGSYGDLEALAAWSHSRGASVVATLPLFATFGERAEDVSPYAPISRLFWNELYLDVPALPEFQSSIEARKRVESKQGQAEIAALNDLPLVDYGAVLRFKRRVLETLAAEIFASSGPRREALERALAQRPELARYAAFRAIRELGSASCIRADELAAMRADDGLLGAAWRYHAYVQWAAGEQVSRLAARARDAQTPWYLDFPLGVHGDGFDVHEHRALFAPGVAGGAPPDGFFTEGQNWGFPPLNPRALRASGYAYWRECLAHSMRHAGMLRLDHVMGLHRLYWVPDGLRATEGVYVRYPADELYAVLSVESHRHQSAVIGENLGTVPAEVNVAMARRGLGRMYVAQFAVGARRPALRAAEPGAVASINTHDTPTWAGYWTAADVDDRVEMGLLQADKAEQERAQRGAMRRALVAELRKRGHHDVSEDDILAVLDALLLELARSRAALLLVNLEDLWGELGPQNVPGTLHERPNWRRRLRLSLEQLANDHTIAARLDRLALLCHDQPRAN